MKDQFLKIDEVAKVTKLSHSTIYRMEQAGTFPKKIKLSERSIVWSAKEVTKWMDSKSSTEDMGGENGNS